MIYTYWFHFGWGIGFCEKKDPWDGRHAEQSTNSRFALFEAGRTTQAGTAFCEEDAALWVAQGHINGLTFGPIRTLLEKIK